MAASLNCEQLLSDGIISQDTFEWFAPLLKKNQEEAEQLCQVHQFQQILFPSCDDFETLTAGGSDSSAMLDNYMTLSLGEASRVVVRYCSQTGASGHGDTVWAASIAICRYLETIWVPEIMRVARKNGTGIPGSLRILELGAGTAIPSLFLGESLARQQEWSIDTQIHITDARQYANIYQILLSLYTNSCSPQSKSHPKVTYRVYPHNWGEPSINDQNRGEGSDLILASDCIYNPAYHDHLLESIFQTLSVKGRAIIAFSLHGNTPDELVWGFFDKARQDKGLKVRAVVEDGWDMEAEMKRLDLWKHSMNPRRWIAHVYELTHSVESAEEYKQCRRASKK
jgi:predicted nicotinamide N-methyase